MTTDDQQRIIEQYQREIPRYAELGRLLDKRLSAILLFKNIRLQSITWRVKSLESVVRKLSLFPQTVRNLEEIRDLLGIRIITYFESDARAVIQAIQDEFGVHGSDVLSTERSQKAVYSWYHLFVQMSPECAERFENRSSAGLMAEVQVQTLVTQALSEIEHEVAYRRDPDTTRLLARILELGGLLNETVNQLSSDILARNLAVTELLADRREKTRRTGRERLLTRKVADSLIDDFVQRLRTAKREEDVQVFLTEHPELLYPEFIKCYSKFALGEDYETDYVLLVQGYQGPEYVFVEIEHPKKNIFTKAGQFAGPFTQAKNQLLDWEHWITKNHDYIARKLPELYKPRFHLVMGRDSMLTPDHKEKLKTEFYSTDRRFSTYDDIESRFRRIIDRLLGPNR